MDKNILVSLIGEVLTSPGLMALHQSLAQGKTYPHGWIIESSPWKGAHMLLKALPDYITQVYPDIFAKEDIILISSSSQKNILIEDIDHIQQRIASTPRKKAYLILIPHSDQLTDGAVSLLLKSLEEPPTPTFFLMSTWDSRFPIGTIRSRCTIIQQNISLPKHIENRDLLENIPLSIHPLLRDKQELLLILHLIPKEEREEWCHEAGILMEKHAALLQKRWSIFDFQTHLTPLLDEEKSIHEYLPSQKETFFLTFEHALGTISRDTSPKTEKSLLESISNLRRDFKNHRNKKISFLKALQHLSTVGKG